MYALFRSESPLRCVASRRVRKPSQHWTLSVQPCAAIVSGESSGVRWSVTPLLRDELVLCSACNQVNYAGCNAMCSPPILSQSSVRFTNPRSPCSTPRRPRRQSLHRLGRECELEPQIAQPPLPRPAHRSLPGAPPWSRQTTPASLCNARQPFLPSLPRLRGISPPDSISPTTPQRSGDAQISRPGSTGPDDGPLTLASFLLALRRAHERSDQVPERGTMMRISRRSSRSGIRWNTRRRGKLQAPRGHRCQRPFRAG
jgi:hypothetical protein